MSGRAGYWSSFGGKPHSAGWFALVFCLPVTMAWGLLWLLLIALYALVSAQNAAVGITPSAYLCASSGLASVKRRERERDTFGAGKLFDGNFADESRGRVKES